MVQVEWLSNITAYFAVRKLVGDVTLICQLYWLSSQFLTKIATFFREKAAMLSFALRQLFLVKISCCSEADIALSSHNPTETSGKTADKRR